MKKKFLFSLMFVLTTIFVVTGCGKPSSVDNGQKNHSSSIDSDFRNYLTNNYNVNLAKKSTVERCSRDCDYYGYYPLENDLTYAIQISKTKDSYEVSYDNKAVAIRAELYKYIASQKGQNYVKNYLQFYDNGNSGHISYSSIDRYQLSYIVYYDSSVNMENQIYTDYLILQKATNLMNSSQKYPINQFEVYYVNDDRLKQDDWLEKLNIKVDDYGFALSYLDGDKDISSEKYKYHYSISNYQNNLNLSSLSFNEFKDLVKSKMESK